MNGTDDPAGCGAGGHPSSSGGGHPHQVLCLITSLMVRQAAVLEGIPRLQAEGVPTRRPDDYLAQMVKSDEQMDKVTSPTLTRAV